MKKKIDKVHIKPQWVKVLDKKNITKEKEG